MTLLVTATIYQQACVGNTSEGLTKEDHERLWKKSKESIEQAVSLAIKEGNAEVKDELRDISGQLKTIDNKLDKVIEQNEKLLAAQLATAEFEGIRFKGDPSKVRIDLSDVLGIGESGGGGIVYAGTMGRESIAVKRINLQGQDTVRLILEECKKLKIANESSDYAVRCYGIITQNGVYYLLMQRCSCTLEQFAQSLGSNLNMRVRVELCSELSAAYEHMHGLKLFYFDIKMSNVLMTAEGRFVISDFGSVTDISASGSEDVLAFGKMIFEIITGTKFDKAHMTATLSETVGDEKVRRPLENLLKKCLDPNPLKRKSMSEIYSKFQKILLKDLVEDEVSPPGSPPIKKVLRELMEAYEDNAKLDKIPSAAVERMSVLLSRVLFDCFL